MTGDRLKYINAYLNSRVCEWYFDKIAGRSGAGTRRWIKLYVEHIYIPQILNSEIEITLTTLVSQIQRMKQNNENALKHEKEIDSIFYNMIGLSQREMQEIETAEL